MLIPTNERFRQDVKDELQAQNMSEARLIHLINKGRDKPYSGLRQWLNHKPADHNGKDRQIGLDYAAWVAAVLEGPK